MANAAMSALEDLMKKQGITPPEEKKEVKKAAKKPAAKQGEKKDSAKKASAKAPAKTEVKAPAKTPVKKSVAKAEAKVSAKAPVKKAPVKAAPKKKEVEAAIEKAPVVEVNAVEEPVAEKAESGKSICISSYFLPSEVRLMKAAAKKEKTSLSKYVVELVRKDLSDNEALYEEAAQKMEAIAAQLESL